MRWDGQDEGLSLEAVCEVLGSIGVQVRQEMQGWCSIQSAAWTGGLQLGLHAQEGGYSGRVAAGCGDLAPGECTVSEERAKLSGNGFLGCQTEFRPWVGGNFILIFTNFQN